MIETYSPIVTELGISLANLIAKGTASVIATKVRTLKDVKEVETLRATYEGLLNEVIQEREEAVRIAQAYKAELERIYISDEDIEHLNTTVSHILDIIKTLSPEVSLESFEVIKEMISVDTLKTMQLLGFNYKAAIGEPLTELCAGVISAWGDRRKALLPKNKQLKR